MSEELQETSLRDLTNSRQRISDEIQKSARALRFSSSKRRAVHKIVGLRPRIQDQIFKLVIILSFILLLIIPIVSAIIYYGFIATNQYTSEARFIVRPGEFAVSSTKSDIAGGTPSSKIVQDTLVVKNYMTSPGLVRDLSKNIDLTSFFTKDNIDFISRLKNKALNEDVLSYWETMIDVGVSSTSGIVTVELQAFSAEDAQTILTEVMELAEARVNKLNENLWSELKASAQSEFENAQLALENARLQYRTTQIDAGIFNLNENATNLETLIKDEQTELLKIQSERKLLGQYLGGDSPRMRVLTIRERIKTQQIKNLRDRLAGRNSEETSLSAYNAKFTQAKLERDIAEKRFENAAEEREKINILSSIQLVYLHAFLDPTLAQRPSHPRRILAIGIAIMGSFFAFGAVVGGGALIYRQID